MKRYRDKRLASFFRQEISNMLLKGELKDHRIKGFITITAAECSKDLRHANIYISAMDAEEDEKKEIVKGFQSAAGYIIGTLSPHIRLKWMPELHFKLDDSLERGAYMLQKLDKLAEERANYEQNNPTQNDSESASSF